MTTEIALATPLRGTLALTGDQIEWTPVQSAALAHIGIHEAPQADQQVFMHVAQRTGLDPFARQIYMIPRNEKQQDGTHKVKWTIQTGIDGFRLIAERHPRFAGTLDPEWCGTDGVWHDAWVDRLPPVAARVKVLRHDRAHPIALPVRFAEFAATFKDGNLQGQWKTKPAHMIGKVAEAAALRKAFPQDFSGVFIPEEMDRDEQAPAYGTPRSVEGRVTADELTGRRSRPVIDQEPVATAEPSDRTPAQDDAGADAADPAPPVRQARKPITLPTQKALFALFGEAGLGDKDDDDARAKRLRICEILAEPAQPLTSSNDLTDEEGRVVEDLLRAAKDKPAYVAQLLADDDAQRTEDATAGESR